LHKNKVTHSRLLNGAGTHERGGKSSTRVRRGKRRKMPGSHGNGGSYGDVGTLEVIREYEKLK